MTQFLLENFREYSYGLTASVLDCKSGKFC